MSAPSTSHTRGDAGTAAVFRCLVGVGVVCAMLITAARAMTAPTIAEHQRQATQRAVLAVLPGAVQSRAFSFGDRGFVPAEPSAGGKQQPAVHAGFDSSGSLVGVAVEAQGMGYQDTIRLLYGYSPEKQRVLGLRVLQSRETPGLGDKIESDPGFLQSFASLDVTLDERGRLLHPVARTPAAKQREPWQVDVITGATVSSKAVIATVGESADTWLVRIQERKGELRP